MEVRLVEMMFETAARRALNILGWENAMLKELML